MRVAILTAVALAACEEDKNPKIEAAKAAQSQLLDATAARLAECAGAGAESVRGLLSIQPIGYVDLAKGVKAGRLVLEPAKLASCVAYLRQAPCDKVRAALEPSTDTPCKGVFAGQVRADYSCYSGFDCAAGSYCGADDLKCPGKCKAFGAEDAPCTDRELCAPGLQCTCTTRQCTARACKAASKKGAPCGKADNASCEEGLYCVPLGAPGANTCQPMVGLGQLCPSTDACAAPMKCIGLDSAQRPGKCQLPKAKGDVCTVGLRECTDLATCMPKEGSKGVCTTWGGAGAACGPVAQDKEYAGCIGGYCDTNVCKAYKQKGDPCAVGGFLDFACGPGRCDHVMSKCVYPCMEP